MPTPHLDPTAGRRSITHTAKNTMEYLRRENISFIEPDMWPPNSPDLNPVDYAVWGALQQMVYRRRSFTTVDELRETTVTEWTKLSQRFIDRAIDQWRRRLQCAVWGPLQEMVYRRRSFTTVDELKETIVTEWTKLSQRFIDRAIDQWRRRLQCVVQQQGGHIEHFM